MADKDMLTDEEKNEQKNIKRDLYTRGILCALIILVLLLATLAWFFSSRDISLDGIELAAGGNGGTVFTLYELVPATNGEENTITVNGQLYKWEQTENIQLEQPNEVHRYMLVSSDKVSKITFTHVVATTPDLKTAESVTQGLENHTKGILDFTYMLPITQEGATASFANYTDIAANLDGYNKLSDGTASGYAYDAWTTITAGGLSGYVFDMYLHKDVCNHYTGATVSATLSLD